MKKKIGIFGGSFDPVHFGHLNLAVNLMEKAGLQEVLFILTSLSPFKESARPVASAAHRLSMLKLVAAHLENCNIIEWEMQKEGPAYTIDTVRRLKQDPALELHLLIGDDHLPSLHKWKDFEDLIRLAPPLIGTRNLSGPLSISHLPADLQKKCEEGRVQIPQFDISSTDIRARLSQKKYCGHLVPSSVLEYIEKNKLYNGK